MTKEESIKSLYDALCDERIARMRGEGEMADEDVALDVLLGQHSVIQEELQKAMRPSDN